MAQDRRTDDRWGYEGAPGYGRPYGRDFGQGGFAQGFDGRHAEGYGGSFAPMDYRDADRDEGWGAGMAAANYGRSFEGRGQDYGEDARTWMDRRTESNVPAGPHGGKGPKGWTRSDARIREQVCEALTDDALLDARTIGVEVKDGVVTLTGTAPGASDATLAEMIVRRVGGVKDVKVDLARSDRPERAPRPTPGIMTGAEGSPLKEGEHDPEGREEGPRHFPKLAT